MDNGSDDPRVPIASALFIMTSFVPTLSRYCFSMHCLIDSLDMIGSGKVNSSKLMLCLLVESECGSLFAAAEVRLLMLLLLLLLLLLMLTS